MTINDLIEKVDNLCKREVPNFTEEQKKILYNDLLMGIVLPICGMLLFYDRTAQVKWDDLSDETRKKYLEEVNSL